MKAEFFYRALPWTELILRDRQLHSDLNLNWSSRVSVILTYGLLVILLGAWWSSKLLVIAATILLLLLLINAPVYQFFQHKRGWLFTLQIVPWHLFYYFYSGLAFAIGSVRHWFRRTPLSLISLKP